MTVAEIFTTYGPGYLQNFGERMPENHKKVILAIIACRTPRLGTIVCACEDCADTYRIFRSCGSRHCPTCQGERATSRLNTRLDQPLPVDHFMITCTVPSAFRQFFRSHQRFAYSALFQATSSTISSLASEPTYFPGDTPGFFGVLHTWGRQLQYHPHIHYVVPGGAFCSSDCSWHSSHQAFYLPVRIMAAQIKSRFLHLTRKAGLLHLLPSDAWEKDWNVNSQPAGNGARSVRYLASYVFRTAISDHRIIAVRNEQVLFRYTDTKTGRTTTMSLSAFEFIRRFLQHVLPTGFMKIRYYGFMQPSTTMPVKLAVALLEALFTVAPKNLHPPRSPAFRLANIATGSSDSCSSSAQKKPVQLPDSHSANPKEWIQEDALQRKLSHDCSAVTDPCRPVSYALDTTTACNTDCRPRSPQPRAPRISHLFRRRPNQQTLTYPSKKTHFP